MGKNEGNMNRRAFVELALAAGTLAATGSIVGSAGAEEKKQLVPFVKLPYKPNQLEPYLSQKTVDIHYYKHHQAYFTKVNQWVAQRDEFRGKNLEVIIGQTKNRTLQDASLYHMAILLFNHNFYWQSMKPGGGGEPERRSEIGKAFKESFESYNVFRARMHTEAAKLGSGWVWLVKAEDRLRVMHTAYHESPLLHYFTPLAALDVWEHAYYIDYQNDKARYVDAYLDHLVNWDFAEAQLGDR